MMQTCEFFVASPAPMPCVGMTSPCKGGAATADGSSVLPVSLSIFVDTYVSAPPRIIAPRDFTFKAVVGEPSW